MDIVPMIPKTKESFKGSDQLNIPLYVLGCFFIFSIVAYFVLGFYIESAKQDFENLDKELLAMATPEKLSLEKEILNIERKTKSFSLLTKNHLISSDVFNIIESTTHPQVWFFEFDLTPEKGDLLIFGQTQNFRNLGQQIFIFEEEPAIIKVELEEVSINREGKIEFALLFYFRPDIFKIDF